MINKAVWLIVVIGFLIGCGGASEAQQAYDKCREAVEDQLVAPASAEFPPVADIEIVRKESKSEEGKHQK